MNLQPRSEAGVKYLELSLNEWGFILSDMLKKVLTFYTKYFAVWVIAFGVVAYLVPKPFVAYRIMNNSAGHLTVEQRIKKWSGQSKKCYDGCCILSIKRYNIPIIVSEL